MVFHPSFFLRHQIKINRVIEASGCYLKAGWSSYSEYSKDVDRRKSIYSIDNIKQSIDSLNKNEYCG